MPDISLMEQPHVAMLRPAVLDAPAHVIDQELAGIAAATRQTEAQVVPIDGLEALNRRQADALANPIGFTALDGSIEVPAEFRRLHDQMINLSLNVETLSAAGLTKAGEEKMLNALYGPEKVAADELTAKIVAQRAAEESRRIVMELIAKDEADEDDDTTPAKVNKHAAVNKKHLRLAA